MSTVRDFFTTSPNCSFQAGDIVAFAADDYERDGFLLCDGYTMLVSQYEALFNVIGYLYGGSGPTFDLPDFRNYFIRGWDGVNSNPLGVPQSDSFQTHTHGYWLGNSGTYNVDQVHRSTRLTTYESSDSIPNQGTETRPRNMSVKFSIRYI